MAYIGQRAPHADVNDEQGRREALALEPRRGGWAASLYARVTSEVNAERRVDRQYQDLVKRTMAGAATRGARADVAGLVRNPRSLFRSLDPRL